MDYEPETSEYAVTCVFVVITVLTVIAIVLDAIARHT
jgi:hypothetical protein